MKLCLFLKIVITFVSIFTTSALLASNDKGVSVIPLSEDLYFFRVESNKGNTSTVVLIGEEGSFLIDPNFNETSDIIKSKIQELGGGDIRYLTSSHDHRDHIEQYKAFAEGAVIIVPENQKESVTYWGGKPDITYKGALTIHFNGQDIQLSTLPSVIGHTNGDELVYFTKNNVLYVGDYFFATGFPIIDKSSGDIQGYIKNLDFIVSNYDPDTIIIPGHTTFPPEKMKLFTVNDIATFASDLRETIEYIHNLKNKNMTLEQIQQKGLPVKFERYDEGIKFIDSKRWIERVFNYLSSSIAK